MENPLVSVLMASYNHAPFVEDAVRSVMAQKGVSFELIVIDDGSFDDSPEILKKLSEEYGFSFISRKNRGLVPTMNEMLRKAKGKYFCSFASDDMMPENRLKIQSAYLENHPDKAACFGQARSLDRFGNLSLALDKRYLKSVPEVDFEDLFLGRKVLHGCTEMIVTKKMLALGGYDERFFIEDYPTWLLLSDHFGTLPVLDLVFCHYRFHETNMHKRTDSMYSQCLKIIEIYKEHPLYLEAKRCWKAYWFSNLAFSNKKKALLYFPQLFSFSRVFFQKIPKLFFPSCLLKRL